MSKILGIDPGIERLGWGVIEKNGSAVKIIDSGVKKTLKTQPEASRLWEIWQFLDKLIVKERPEVLSTEKLFFAKNVKTALVISEVRGLILALAEKHKLTIREFTPLEVKMAICGYGKASKENVSSMLKLFIDLPKKQLLDDETDAIALAITALSIATFP